MICFSLLLPLFMKTNARMNNVRANTAPIMVQRQSVHFLSYSIVKILLTSNGKLAELIQFLLEHFKFNIINRFPFFNSILITCLNKITFLFIQTYIILLEYQVPIDAISILVFEVH
jgi:hypothetical protein